MISARAARAQVLRFAHALPAVRVPLLEANGRVLAASIRAPFPLPRFTDSAMDGYAIRASETRRATRARPARFRIRRRAIYAGSAVAGVIPAGTAVPIMTGGPLPRGLDAVLPREEARFENGSLVVRRPVSRHRYVRLEGEDCRRGATIARAGARVDAGLIALLAACGVAAVDVHGAPRVALVVTGDEVRPLSGRALGPHAVFDAHSSFLRAALREFGIDPVLVGRSRDRAAALRAAIGRALDRADLVLVTGGVSMGERDLVRPVLESLGVETVFRGVSQKPGKPLLFGAGGAGGAGGVGAGGRGARSRTLVFGLPGNPVSTVVCYCEYVRPCVARMMGIRELGGTRTAELDGDGLAPLPRQTRFVRGTIRRGPGTWTVRPVIPEGSHRYGPFRESDCLIALPPGAPTKVRSRARVTIHPFPWKKS